ncbi:conserved hypothetical protein [Methylocella tundrae]|uniref:Uncharacterized protein n=1 Tax=Methylocella tundrae TaxID=227605 RepID=A0A8B6M3D1_METTU|nr:hypothetical protein [Methylocella tundrae]VTZ49265.1 conserved hypothetical protein [Methylocella tundrae]
MSALRMFIPITKVDAAQRLVYGLATAEAEDRAGEICDYASTKPLYEKWSAEIAKSTAGKSLGNLRAMHGPVAAGKVTEINFNDTRKQIEICAKVIDDAEWVKVAEGVYTGFSQGGAYARRWTDEDGLTRYTADPTEISLVDLPCLPQAQFEMIKADGTRELRSFGKDLDAVARLACLIDELNDLQSDAASEANAEQDDSNVPDRLRDLVTRASAILRAMANEETAELGPAQSAGAQSLAMSAAPSVRRPRASAKLSKIGARNSEADQHRVQQMHDTSVDLGAECNAQKSMSGGLEKRFDALATTIDDVLRRVKQIESQPLPLPFAGSARSISKSEDAGLDTRNGDAVEKLLLDPEALSVLAIKLAQRNGRAPMR